MGIDCTLISDLHGHYPKDLPGGDLLIVAGDVTNNDHEAPFAVWIEEQPYEKIVWIAGNHDNIWYKSWLEHGEKRRPRMKEGKWKGPERNEKIEYLCDNGTIFKDLRIWGSPWSKTFSGMNPHCKAFTVDTEEELAEKWALIPDDVDILVTHSPPASRMLDITITRDRVGSLSLYEKTSNSPRNLQLHVFGHVHESYGEKYCKPTRYVNASHVNERYEPVNNPVRIIL